MSYCLLTITEFFYRVFYRQLSCFTALTICYFTITAVTTVTAITAVTAAVIIFSLLLF